MKRIYSSTISRLLLLSVFAFAAYSCEDPDAAPVVTFDTAGKGAYPRQLGETGALLMNLLTEADFNSSDYGWTVEFVDQSGGSSVAEYTVEVTYDAVSGNDQGPLELVTVPASSFTMGESGFVQTTIDTSAPEIAALFGLSYADLEAGDEFDIRGTITTTDGRTFAQSNSSATVVGPAFVGYFNFSRPVACPSDLTGTFSVTTSDVWCDGSSTTVDVDIVALGGGRYEFSDWSFGAYGVCYGGGSAGGDLTFTEVCEVVSFTGFTDSFGDTWTFTSSVDGDTWTIDWVNTYDESGSSVITWPGGVPFTLAD